MAVQLVRRPGIEGVNFANPAASRAWIREHIRDELKLRGAVHPKVYLLGRGFVETFDIDAMSQQDPTADVGVTFQLLRRRANVQRCFLVLGADAIDQTGAEHTLAVLFEEVYVANGRRWWMAMLEYQVDPATGFGLPFGDWQCPPRDMVDPSELPPVLGRVANPPPGARPAGIRAASATWQPDIQLAFGELPAHMQPPADAKQMVETAAALGVVNELLTGRIHGAVVVRITGRSWEKWILEGDMPASILEMIRWIANHRLPAAEAVALAQVAIRPQDEPPVPGVQVVAEKDGMFVETWAPIQLPDGPAGRKVVPRVHWWPARPVQPDRAWIGIASKAELEGQELA